MPYSFSKSSSVFDVDPKTIKYIAYVRKSTEEADRQAMSIDAQIKCIKQAYPTLDITFIKGDDGTLGESKSAAKPNNRPLFNKMLKDLSKGKYQGVIAWHPDRLARNALDAAEIVMMIQQGHIQDLKFCNFSFEPTPEGIMMLQMIMSQAQYFSAKLSKDVRRGNRQKREKGGITGVAPMGYLNHPGTPSMIPDPERFDTMRKAFELIMTGEYSIKEIAEIMNEKWGFRTLQRKKLGGRPVSVQGLHKAFHNPLYAGFVPDPYSDKLFKGDFEPMITEAERDRVIEVLSRTGNGVPHLTKTIKKFPLRGFIRCGVCGCQITAHERTKHQKNGNTHVYRYYHCTHRSRDIECHQGAIREEDLQAQLEELLGQYEITPQLYEWGMKALKEIADSEKTDRNNIQDMQARTIKETQDTLDNLLDLVARGVITADQYKQKSAEIEARLAKLQEEQTETSKRVQNWYEIVGTTLQCLDTATERFNDGDINDKRRILSALGSDPILKDGKLSIKEHFWLKPIKEHKHIIYNQVRTCPQQIENAPSGAIYQRWRRVRDLNPRSRLPQTNSLAMSPLRPLG